MADRLPGELIAGRLAVLPGGALAEVVITGRTAPYERLREAYARWHADGGWSAWRLVAGAVQDVSVVADTSQGEPSALVSAVVWVRLPEGAIAATYEAHRLAYYRLTAAGIVPADL
jgi:hypothetical protein